MNRVRELEHSSRLEHVGGGACLLGDLDPFPDPLLENRAADQDNTAMRLTRPDDFRGLDSVHERHDDVYGHDIGRQFTGEHDCLLPVVGFPDDLEPLVELQHCPQSLQEGRIVIGHEDPYLRFLCDL